MKHKGGVSGTKKNLSGTEHRLLITESFQAPKNTCLAQHEGVEYDGVVDSQRVVIPRQVQQVYPLVVEHKQDSELEGSLGNKRRREERQRGGRGGNIVRI